jgi:hypothetical protein
LESLNKKIEKLPNLDQIGVFSFFLKKQKKYPRIVSEVFKKMKATGHLAHIILSAKWPIYVCIDHHNLLEIEKFAIIRNHHIKWSDHLHNIQKDIRYVSGQ